MVDAASRRVDVVGLVTEVARLEPWWLPTVDVADGRAVREWFGAKPPCRSLVACTSGGAVVGHLAVRLGTTPLVDALLPHRGAPGGWFELCRAVVHPAWRRQGVLAALVGAAYGLDGLVGRRPWLTCVTGTPAHAAWQHLGFDDVADVVFPADVDGRPGTLCVAPRVEPGAGPCCWPHGARDRVVQ